MFFQISCIDAPASGPFLTRIPHTSQFSHFKNFFQHSYDLHTNFVVVAFTSTHSLPKCNIYILVMPPWNRMCRCVVVVALLLHCCCVGCGCVVVVLVKDRPHPKIPFYIPSFSDAPSFPLCSVTSFIMLHLELLTDKAQRETTTNGKC